MKKFFAYILGACMAFFFKAGSTLGSTLYGTMPANIAYGVSPNPDSLSSVLEKIVKWIFLPVIYIPLILLVLVIGLAVYLFKKKKK